jgi:hypothetical protein
MDRLQEQVRVLGRKVDTLQAAIDQLNNRLSPQVTTADRFPPTSRQDIEMIADTTVVDVAGVISELVPSSHSFAQGHLTLVGSEERSADILMDDSYPEAMPKTHDKALTPELQIQRLMAQLTAAYNRIADLEEQLLAQRKH